MQKIAALLTIIVSMSTAPAYASHDNSYQSCQYGSTQARVQEDINHHWDRHITVGCNRSFNIGSFHDGTGQFADDTNLKVSGPDGFEKSFHANEGNGKTISVPQDGTYWLEVTTQNQYGEACSESVSVIVSCTSQTSDKNVSQSSANNDPTFCDLYPEKRYCQSQRRKQSTNKVPIHSNTNKTCNYSSTQARVQLDIEHHWAPDLTVSCFDSINTGSFHDGTGQFATDTTMKLVGQVKIPLLGNFTIERRVQNGQRIKLLFPGTYRLKVETQNQSGSSCQEEATVNVECNDWQDFTQDWSLK